MKNIYYEKFRFGGTDMSNLRLNKITLLLLLILVLSLKSVEGSKAIEVFNNESVEESGNFVFKELDEVKDIYSDILIDRITNDKNVITGKTFKNSIVKFNINNVEYVSNTDDDGNFVVLVEEGLLIDIDQIRVKVCDYLDNELSNLSLVVHDILPPVDPKIDGIVNNSDFKVMGSGEPNSIVKLIIGDKEFLGYILNDGNFEIEVGDSLRNVDKFKLISYDYFNNYSNLVEKCVEDVIAPEKPTVTNIDFINNLVYGNGEANCEVVVSFDGKSYKSYIDENGYFYIHDDEGLLENTEHIKIHVVDLSGNSSEEVLFGLEKKNVGVVTLRSLDPNNGIIKDAMIRLNGCDGYLHNEDRVFNLNSEGNLIIEDIPFGDYELLIRYRTFNNQLEENIVNISLNEENSDIEILID